MPDVDRFQGEAGSGIHSPPGDGYAVDASASDQDLNVSGKGISTSIWIGSGGDLEVTLRSGAKLVYVGVPSGYLLVIRAKIIHTLNTTASDIIVHP